MMLRTAFYIVDRGSAGNEETKEPEGLVARGPPEPWTYARPAPKAFRLSDDRDAADPSAASPRPPFSAAIHPARSSPRYAEDLSRQFARAQSVLHDCYGGRTQETGHKTLGHVCVTDDDKRRASETRGSLLYGELLPRGVNKALDPRHLDAARASSLYDLGMGTGKVALQAFLQFPNLARVHGVELSLARYEVAERALLALAATGEVSLLSHAPGRELAVRKAATNQTLHVQHGNLMRTRDIGQAAIVMLETEVPADAFSDFSRLLDGARDGARVLTYLDLRKVWQLPGQPFPFRQLEANRSFADRRAAGAGTSGGLASDLSFERTAVAFRRCKI